MFHFVTGPKEDCNNLLKLWIEHLLRGRARSGRISDGQPIQFAWTTPNYIEIAPHHTPHTVVILSVY